MFDDLTDGLRVAQASQFTTKLTKDTKFMAPDKRECAREAPILPW
jgi:hypothetical protein